MLNDLAQLLPIPENESIRRLIIGRVLRLNCLTRYYAELWREYYDMVDGCSWSIADNRLSEWTDLSPTWEHRCGLRNKFERRQTLIELDVLASISLGMTIDELITIYRVQFPVLQNYERRFLFDQRGYEVPVKTSYGELLINEDHEDFPDMVPPFTPVNREEDYRKAWVFFEERLKEENQ
jgi:hypothetical protein